MSNLIKVSPLLVVIAFIVGCASSPDALKRESAKSIGGGVSPDSITVSDVDRGISTVKWTATSATGSAYGCNADDMLRSVYCAKK